MDMEIFKGRRVLVTGHTGFKGAWLTQILVDAGADVLGFSLAPKDGALFERLGLEASVDHRIGNICDDALLQQVFDEFQPELVFHLAAQAFVMNSYEAPSETYHTNVMGSMAVLEAVRRNESVKALVYITSDKCYENLEWVWGYREDDRLGGHDPYSSSKACAEILFSSYCRSFFQERKSLTAVSVRAGNVIGGGDYAPDRIIPDCIRAIVGGSAIELRNPSATRPWQHVLEPLSGYLTVAARCLPSDSQLNTGDSFNFGPKLERQISVGEVATMVCSLFGKGSVTLPTTAPLVHEANLLQLNCDKAQNILGWSAKWSGEYALRQTVEWYRQVESGGDPIEITRRQITDYFGSIV